jgi:predicted ATPase
MVNKITFKNYKSFKDEQILLLKPITILIGKNSSGKSAVAKLPVLIDNSLNNAVDEPFLMDYQNVQFGGEYRDIFYERIPNAELEFSFTSNSSNTLTVKIVSDFEKNTIPTIIYWKLNLDIELVFNSNNNTYKNLSNGLSYNCEFEGFILIKATTEGGDDLTYSLKDINFKTDYIGPFRVYANNMRSFQLKSFRRIKSVGEDGSEAYQILGIESLNAQSELIKNVSEWYKLNFEGWGLKVNNDLHPFCTIELSREDKKFNINIADVGQGMSQALPLIVNAFLPNSDSLTIIEQPELHLHPAAHGNLAQLFAECSIKYDKKYLIETHSHNFVLRLRRLIAEGKFKAEDLQIYWVDYDGFKNSSTLRIINVNELGEVDYWPENIFSETLDETIAMRAAQVKRKNAN